MSRPQRWMPWHESPGHDPDCPCRLCVLAGRCGPVPADVPTAANPAKVPTAAADQAEEPKGRTLFDEE